MSKVTDFLFNLLLALVLGLFLFRPPVAFVPFGFDKLLVMPSMFYLFMNRKLAKVVFVQGGGMRIILLLAMLLLTHVAVVLLHFTAVRYGYAGFEFAYFDLQKLVVGLPVCCAICVAVIKRYGGIGRLIDIVVLCLGVWLIATVVMIFMPQLNDLVMTQLLRMEDSKFMTLRNRGFGFAAGHLFSFPLQLSTLFLLVFCLRPRRLSYLCILGGMVPLLLLAIIYNARVGLVPLFALSLYAILPIHGVRSLYNIGAVLAVVCVSVLVIQFEALAVLFPGGAEVREWVLKGYYEIVGGTVATEHTNVAALESYLFLPDTAFSVLFGEGLHIYYGMQRSDLGVTIYIFYGGLFYLTSLVVFYACIFPLQAIYRGRMLHEGLLVCMLFGIACVINFKGTGFTTTNIAFLYIFMALYINLHLSERGRYGLRVSSVGSSRR